MLTGWTNAEVFTPRRSRVFHAYATVLWLLMVPVATLMGLLSSVPFISAISIYANVAGHFSAWQAARVEERQANGE